MTYKGGEKSQNGLVANIIHGTIVLNEHLFLKMCYTNICLFVLGFLENMQFTIKHFYPIIYNKICQGLSGIVSI